MRTCKRCGIAKPPSAYSRDKRRKSGRKFYCRRCSYDFYRDWECRKRYGITLAERNDLATQQGGRCACCDDELQPTKHGLGHLDHCHATGRVRGVVCQACNLALGFLRDSPQRARAVIDYLATE